MSYRTNNSSFLSPLKPRTKAEVAQTSSEEPPIELSSRKEGRTSPAQDVEIGPPNTDSGDSATAEIPQRNWKLLSSGFSFFVAGTNDGSMGALLPYVIGNYNIGTSFVALIYFATFLGWLVAAVTNSHFPKFFNLGALLTIGASLQLLSQTLRPWKPPFPLFVITFFFSGLGQAYQDAHTNTFVSSVKDAHNWLGFIHGMYGFGCLISPFVATAIASAQTPSRWTLFYIFPLGLSVINLTAVTIIFRESVNMVKSTSSTDAVIQRAARNKSAVEEVRQMLKQRNIWLISLFFFFSLGVGTTSSGWVVQYLVQIRNGKLADMGYVPSGFYGGLTLGRFLLPEPTHRFGELKMLLSYTVIIFAMQLVFWLVPNIISSAVSFSIMGFFLGPFFVAGISVASRLLPKHIQPAGLGMIFVIAQAGGAIFPSLIGIIAAKAGVKVLQPIVAGLIVIMGITWAFVPKPSSNLD